MKHFQAVGKVKLIRDGKKDDVKSVQRLATFKGDCLKVVKEAFTQKIGARIDSLIEEVQPEVGSPQTIYVGEADGGRGK